MARVFITGSSEGLGLLAGKLLVEKGHEVTLHARNETRKADAQRALPSALRVAVGDLASLAGMRQAAEDAKAGGPFDAVIHNAGVGYQHPRRTETPDGLEVIFATNVLAPYVLTALMPRPSRLVYLSSGMHRGGTPNLDDPQWSTRRWSGSQAYSDSKLLDVVLAFGVARRWPNVLSNAVHPGWVPTRMGGRGAPDDLRLGGVTQSWLAVSDEPAAKITGHYFFHQKVDAVHPAASEEAFQDELLAYAAKVSGVKLPD